MERKNMFLRCQSLILACLLLMSMVAPVTAHAALLDDVMILPDARDWFGGMIDWEYSEKLESTMYSFEYKKEPYQQMKTFAKEHEAYGLVLKTDKKTDDGSRFMELAHEGKVCVTLLWYKDLELLSVCYENGTAMFSEKEDGTILYLGMKEYPQSQVNDFVKRCSKELGTTAEKAFKASNGDRLQELKKDGKIVISFFWYESDGILLVQFSDSSILDKLDITLPADRQQTGSDNSKNDVRSKNNELPDLASFLETKYTQDEWGYTHYVTCIVDDNDDIVEAVLDLLEEPRYQLKQMGKSSDSDGTHYTYEYTGTNKDIDWVYLKNGGKYHVKLTVKPYGSNQKALILYSFPEFYLADPGKTWKDMGDPDPTPNPTPDPTPNPTPVPDPDQTVKVREDTTIRIKQGSAVKLHCTYNESASYRTYEWSIESGSSVISIDATHNKCDVQGVAKGTAVIKMKYSYSYEGRDVLTGNKRNIYTSKTREYTIIVE